MPVKIILSDIDGCISPEESMAWDEALFAPVRIAGELLGGLATVVGDRRWRSEAESSVRAVFEDAPVPMAVLRLSGVESRSDFSAFSAAERRPGS